jgi:hypothetical protein
MDLLEKNVCFLKLLIFQRVNIRDIGFMFQQYLIAQLHKLRQIQGLGLIIQVLL